MADQVTTKTNAPGLLGDGLGGVDRSSPATYRQTPKYGDPYAKGNANRLARFFFSSELISEINQTFNRGKGASDVQLSVNDTVLNKLSNQTAGYFEFFLQSADESFEERFQIVETLGDNYAVFGIGRKPRIFNFAGALLNSVENDWRVNFIYLFQQYISISRLAKFRGTKTKNVVTLKYDSVFLQGAILNLRTALRADNELVVPFSFTMLVTNWNFVDLTKLNADKLQTDNQTPTTPESTGLVLAGTNSDELFALSASNFAAGTA